MLSYPMGAIYALYLNVLTQGNLKENFSIERMSLLLIKQRNSVSEPPFGVGRIGVTNAIHLYLVGIGNFVVEFL